MYLNHIRICMSVELRETARGFLLNIRKLEFSDPVLTFGRRRVQWRRTNKQIQYDECTICNKTDSNNNQLKELHKTLVIFMTYAIP